MQLPADDVIRRLRKAMYEGGGLAFDIVPMFLREIIERKLWTERLDRDKEPFKSFELFVAAKLPEGLESTIDDLLAFSRKQPEVQGLIRGASEPLAKHGEIGGGHVRDSNTTSDGRGATYILKRLKRDRPDLAERVAAGQLSANAAAIEAGFRKRTFPVPDDLNGAIAVIQKRFHVAIYVVPDRSAA